MMEKFDPETAWGIERYGVTHSQWVPTMFVRMLKLPKPCAASSTSAPIGSPFTLRPLPGRRQAANDRLVGSGLYGTTQVQRETGRPSSPAKNG